MPWEPELGLIKAIDEKNHHPGIGIARHIFQGPLGCPVAELAVKMLPQYLHS